MLHLQLTVGKFANFKKKAPLHGKEALERMLNFSVYRYS